MVNPRLIALGAVVAIAAAVGFLWTRQANDVSGWPVYRSETHRLEIRHPRDVSADDFSLDVGDGEQFDQGIVLKRDGSVFASLHVNSTVYSYPPGQVIWEGDVEIGGRTWRKYEGYWLQTEPGRTWVVRYETQDGRDTYEFEMRRDDPSGKNQITDGEEAYLERILETLRVP